MSDQPYPIAPERPRMQPVDRALPPSRPDPFTPRVAMPPSRPIAKPEEGERRGEGLAVMGSGAVVLGLAALIAWLLYLALG
ncbi:hypothetical protein HB662_28285 [Roseomonas frigidaquae]|uniref:Uncharacterized protein n=1 Tax=Falsiroseomonas frigidaquae TaxID=487318 RepID=A0ABX1F8S2_9PROT|nr:hypothetical protein [Falsiroseomonas frigidaquae]NKE48697.1 hypothetical protein [Falsiroseomonas frigidaquae]